MKCLQCPKRIKPGLWCSIKCKANFYKKYYLGSILVEKLEDNYKKERLILSTKAMKKFEDWKIKNKGKGFFDFLRSNVEIENEAKD